MSDIEQTSPETDGEETGSDPRLQQAAENSGYPVEAVAFAHNCLALAPYLSESSPGHISATTYCRIFLESVMDDFLGKTMAVLAEWRITRSEDLGRIVYALIDVGLSLPDGDDRFSDFDGVFDIEKEYFSWADENEAEKKLEKEERDSHVMFAAFTLLGTLFAVVCVAAAAHSAAETRFPLYAFATASVLVPVGLWLLVRHGYQRVKNAERTKPN